MINIVKKYLSKNNYSHLKNDFEGYFLSHPNYPSLFAITDSLEMLAIENVALKIPKEQFVELPNIFIALFKEELALVSKKDNSVIIETEKGKKKNLPSEEFLKDWNQVIVVIEPNAYQNKLLMKNSYSKALLYILLFMLLVFLSFFLFNFSSLNFAVLSSTIIGLVLSILILQEKYGIKTEFGSKLCNINVNASCESVIDSNRSQIVKGLSFYDLPILFFGINFLSILIDPINSTLIILALSLISVPFLFYSIWLQKIVLKKWCVLCLAVSSIIFIQGTFCFLQSHFLKSLSFSDCLVYLQSVILITSSWFLIRSIIENNIKLKGELGAYKRIKRDFKVFKSLMKRIEILEGFENLKGIEYGDLNAPIKVTLFLSPSCGHCHQTFRDAKNLFDLYPKTLYLNILFNINPENSGNKYLTVVETLLTLNSRDAVKAKEALNDWHGQNSNLESWKLKWAVKSYDMIANNQIFKQYQWCVVNKLNFTPIKIVNNELFPNEYVLEDLKYFINNYEAEYYESLQSENFKIV